MRLASGSPADIANPAMDPSDDAHEWALVDVETSGPVARRHRVLSLAVLTVGADGARREEFATLLDPGVDPGPVHLHGLTPERLRGAPEFEVVADRVAGMLRDRVLVAHNAQFGYDFLAHEFARAGRALPVSRRLCTLALSRRVDPPTEDLRLSTLAAHYGVPRARAHDALEDTRVLAGVFRASLGEAGRLGVPLPFVACPPRQDARYAPQPPKTPCPYGNPGRLAPGGPLTQGMKVAFTAATATARTELAARCAAAGLNVVGSVSRHTSVLVAEDAAAGSAKARRAAAEGVPVVDEATLLRLLADVREGTPHEQTAPPAPDAATRRVPRPRTPRAPAPAWVTPLAGRRVLVLGGTHAGAAEARTRVTGLGGAAAVNLSASVTDVVVLAGGGADRRMAKIAALDIPTYGAEWLEAPFVPHAAERPAPARPEPKVLPRGGVLDLPDTATAREPQGPGVRGRVWQVAASWAQRAACEVDLVGFVLDGDEQVACEGDFVFYGAPENPDGSVRLLTDGPAEQSLVVDLAALPPGARRVVVAAAIDAGTAATFGELGAVQVNLVPASGARPLAQSTLDAATTERTLLLAELYRRGPLWRFRALGQGYDHTLAALARSYGVDLA